MLTKLDGYKTYLAALALALSAIVSLISASQEGGDYNEGLKMLFEALAIAGLRHRMIKEG